MSASEESRFPEDDPLSVLNLEQRLTIGSDDEVDFLQELQSICLSKSESDISKIIDSEDELLLTISTPQKDPVFSANIRNANITSQQDENPGVCPLNSSSQSVECSNHKSKKESFKSGSSSISRVKSFLPVPRNKVSQFSQNIKHSSSSSSSSNTRQTEAICD